MHGRGNKAKRLRMKNQSEDKIGKNIKNHFELKKENEVIKDRIIIDIKALFQQVQEFCTPVE